MLRRFYRDLDRSISGHQAEDERRRTNGICKFATTRDATIINRPNVEGTGRTSPSGSCRKAASSFPKTDQTDHRLHMEITTGMLARGPI